MIRGDKKKGAPGILPKSPHLKEPKEEGRKRQMLTKTQEEKKLADGTEAGRGALRVEGVVERAEVCADPGRSAPGRHWAAGLGTGLRSRKQGKRES